MLTDLTRRIGGDALAVEGLLGEGVDPHLFKPSASDVKRIQSADAILYSGLYLEGKLQATFQNLRKQGKRVEAVSERLPKERLAKDGGNSDHPDPHVWMDVALWRLVATEVASILSDWYPDHRDHFRANAAALDAELAALDEYVLRIVATVPPGRRVLITAHDAFGYFGHRYGMEVLGIQGISTESEAGIRHLNDLVERIVSDKIPAVFVESTVADKNVRALIEGAAAKGHSVKIGGTLYSDAMGVPGTYTGTYVGMIDHNATHIVRALGGEAPAGGFAGKLESNTP
jgi:manganese/zinc/iron transport system substrate-binding protein